RNSTIAPAGGLYCDAGAYQGLDAGGPTPPGSTIDRVQIGGLPNSTLRVGHTLTLGATVFMRDGSRATSEAVRWASSNPDVVHVDQYGNIVLLALGESYVTVTTQRNSSTGSPATHSILVKVTEGQMYTNIAKMIWTMIAGFNSDLSSSGVQAYLVDSDPVTVTASSFSGAFSGRYGVTPEQITEVSEKNGLVFRKSTDYRQANARGTIAALKPSVGLEMSTLKEPGALLAMKYVYNIDWSDVSAILGKDVTQVSQSDVEALFGALSLAFTDENGANVAVVDKDGSNGVSIADALSSGALLVGGVNTDEFPSNQSLAMHLYVLLGDAKPAGGASVNLIDGKIVVADNEANGRIDGEMWLLKDASASGGENGGSGDGGGGGGGCSAVGFAPLLLAIAALTVASRRKK
ncbi:Ig-like domain-containing protein, partial [Synergistaceae bacterium OttesenSCG-928-I11]|nr:Ig-like domain-containing protein [Synergistaceae bacterium OttesenSCG-928-I11]